MKLSELMLSASLRLYTLLLLIYPGSFRREYGELMIQLFRDPIGDAIRQRGCLGVISYSAFKLYVKKNSSLVGWASRPP